MAFKEKDLTAEIEVKITGGPDRYKTIISAISGYPDLEETSLEFTFKPFYFNEDTGMVLAASGHIYRIGFVDLSLYGNSDQPEVIIDGTFYSIKQEKLILGDQWVRIQTCHECFPHHFHGYYSCYKRKGIIILSHREWTEDTLWLKKLEEKD